jgi:hypothetical protein
MPCLGTNQVRSWSPKIAILILINLIVPRRHTVAQSENEDRQGEQNEQRLIATLLCSALSLIGANGFAHAGVVGRYECNIVGTASQDPIGDRDGHQLSSFQFSCFGVDGLLKEAVYTATGISEWDGPQGTQLLTGGVHRVSGGLAVTQMLQGAGSIILKDGKPAGWETHGKSVFKFASGTLAALSGKTVSYTSQLTGLNRFSIEFAD